MFLSLYHTQSLSDACWLNQQLFNRGITYKRLAQLKYGSITSIPGNTKLLPDELRYVLGLHISNSSQANITGYATWSTCRVVLTSAGTTECQQNCTLPYMVRKVSIHQNDIVASCVSETMCVCSAWKHHSLIRFAVSTSQLARLQQLQSCKLT